MTNRTYSKTDWAAKLVLGLALTLTGLSAGFFATYEYSVTRALLDVSDEVYVATFQAINATIRSPEFGFILFGSLPLLILSVWLNWRSRVTRNLLCLAVIAYIATLVITFWFHIPLNDALAQIDASTDASTARVWFEQPWNQMHLLRTLTVLVSFALTVIASLTFNRSQS